jgi:hypothetical protein
MTFVRAQVTDRGVYAFADWRVTDPDSADVPSVLNGALKLWLMHRNLLIGYAGVIARAHIAIRGVEIDARRGAVEPVVDGLRGASERRDCEFIVATHTPATVTEIKNGVAQSGQHAWLGDQSAFELFQVEYARAASAVGGDGSDEVNRLFTAFHAVLDSGRIPTVGGLTAYVLPENDHFAYGSYKGVDSGYAPTPLPLGKPVIPRSGGVAGGAYAVTFIGARHEPAVGVYFDYGRLGVLFDPSRRDQPIMYRRTAQADFVAQVRADTGLSLGGGIIFHEQADSPPLGDA